MKTDIYQYIKTKWPDQIDIFLDRIREWSDETRGLLGDRLVRSALYLSSDFEEFDGWIAEARDNWIMVYELAEGNGVRDFNHTFLANNCIPRID